MVCPFCLKTKIAFNKNKPVGGGTSVHTCPHCGEPVPGLYVRDYRSYRPVVVNAVGFRQHGKTLYFGALFYVLKKLSLAEHWPDFFTLGLNEDSLNTVYENVAMLEKGILPDSTPKNFPRPTMLRVHGIPLHPDRTLLFFDTGGECFERPSQLVRFAGFVRRARTVLFLVSLPDMDDPAKEMHKLLNTYVVGMGELGGVTREQNLVVVYTKADALIKYLDGWEFLTDYLTHGSLEELADQDHYVRRLHTASERLKKFTRDRLQAAEFLNAARVNFKAVKYTMISALGAKPDGNRLPVEIVPRRVLDPLLWMMEKSVPKWKQLWHLVSNKSILD